MSIKVSEVEIASRFWMEAVPLISSFLTRISRFPFQCTGAKRRTWEIGQGIRPEKRVKGMGTEKRGIFKGVDMQGKRRQRDPSKSIAKLGW
ncbi:hypothetical protein CDAR_284001 [Caerostris darwini]|uniref:Uncharacterized protein n=1 Tax=Caerostris darwini TaxID=1538125 RepID=A0AAV4PMQ1_9ARAC|nr:hypothetical protein CDAR_284001 [Caerostris darwini]